MNPVSRPSVSALKARIFNYRRTRAEKYRMKNCARLLFTLKMPDIKRKTLVYICCAAHRVKKKEMSLRASILSCSAGASQSWLNIHLYPAQECGAMQLRLHYLTFSMNLYIITTLFYAAGMTISVITSTAASKPG